MQTRIIYNGVTLKDVLTEPISHDVVKDSTGVDQLGIRIKIDASAVVHTAAQDHLGVKTSADLAGGLNGLLQKLTKDRRPFKMLIGNSVLYDIRPGAAEPSTPAGTVTADLDAMDLDNGPRPSVQVLKIVSGNSATIRFQCEFVIPNCGDDKGTNSLAQSGLVSFRFWIADDTDCRTWLTTRTYTGRLRVAHKNISPHKLARAIVVPPLQPGFQREVVQLHEGPDGLHLDFTVVDKEFIVAPPWSPNTRSGATDWRGTFSVSTSDFATNYSELNFALTGPKGTSKRDLLAIGLNIVSQKTNYFSFATAGRVFLEQFAIREELAENSIDFAVRLRHTGSSQEMIALFGVNGPLQVGQPLGSLGIGYQPQKAFNPGPSATLTGIFRSLLQTPCNPQAMPGNGSSANAYALSYSAVAGQGNAGTGLPEIPLASSPSPASTAHLAAMYLDYRITSDLEVDAGQIALPTGAGSSSNGPTRAFIQLYQPTADRIISIEASRLTQPPQLPKPNTTFKDANGIEHRMIGKANIRAGVPQLSADARKLLFTASMDLRYGMSRPPKDNESVPVGCVPYRTASASDASRRLPPSTFVAPATILG